MTDIKMKQFSKRFFERDQFWGDLERSQEAYNISKKTTIFHAPMVLDYDSQEAIIAFEFLKNALTIRKLLRSRNYLNIPLDQLEELFFNIGVALAEYHIYSGKLHGDFQPNNVMFEPGKNNIIYLIDFSRSELSNNPNYNRGSIYKDLALFTIHIKFKYPYWIFPLAFRKFNNILCRQMLRGYEKFSKITINPTELRSEIEKYRQKFFKNTFILKFFGWRNIHRI